MADLEGRRAQALENQENLTVNAGLKQQELNQRAQESNEIRRDMAQSQLEQRADAEANRNEIARLGLEIKNREADRRDDAFANKRAQQQVSGYVNKGNAELSPTTAAKIESQNFGVAKTRVLIDQYLASPDTFTGDSSAIQAAIQGMLMNAQRQATDSGANFSESE